MSVYNIKNCVDTFKRMQKKDAESIRGLQTRERNVETSARENINVEETFRAITELVIKSRKEQKARLENDDGRGHAHDGRRGGYGNDAIRVCIQGVSVTTSGIGYFPIEHY